MPKRVDAAQAVIVAALRQFGASVQDIHMVGHGCPDLLVSYRNKNYLFEVKCGDGKLNERERRWHSEWRGKVHIIRNLEEAIQIITEG